MILFDLGHVMGFTVGSTYILHHIAVHSGPGLDDSRFRGDARVPRIMVDDRCSWFVLIPAARGDIPYNSPGRFW